MKTFTWILIVLNVLLLGTLAIIEFSKPTSLGGLVHNTQEIFTAGIKLGTSGQTKFSSTGTLTLGSSGTAITNYLCSSATTWNPSSVTSSTDSYASTTVTVTGAAIGDALLIPVLGTSTNAVDVVLTGKVSAANTVLIRMNASKTVDITTTTVKACVIN